VAYRDNLIKNSRQPSKIIAKRTSHNDIARRAASSVGALLTATTTMPLWAGEIAAPARASPGAPPPTLPA